MEVVKVTLLLAPTSLVARLENVFAKYSAQSVRPQSHLMGALVHVARRLLVQRGMEQAMRYSHLAHANIQLHRRKSVFSPTSGWVMIMKMLLRGVV